MRRRERDRPRRPLGGLRTRRGAAVSHHGPRFARRQLRKLVANISSSAEPPPSAQPHNAGTAVDAGPIAFTPRVAAHESRRHQQHPTLLADGCTAQLQAVGGAEMNTAALARNCCSGCRCCRTARWRPRGAGARRGRRGRRAAHGGRPARLRRRHGDGPRPHYQWRQSASAARCTAPPSMGRTPQRARVARAHRHHAARRRPRRRVARRDPRRRGAACVSLSISTTAWPSVT